MKLIADMHTHTLASDHAYSTIKENAEAAFEQGLKYIAMTDHSVTMPDSPHLWHFFCMRVIPPYIKGVRVIRGIEANIIDYEGNIDIFEDSLYDTLEWVVASFHDPSCLPGTKEQNTKAYLGAIKNPRVNVIGHPATASYDFDYDVVTASCTEHNTLIELNNSRLNSESDRKIYQAILESCKKNGTSIIVNSDAHYCSRVGDFKDSIEFLENINFPEELVINSNLARFERYINNVLKI